MSHYSHTSIPDAKFETDSSASFGNMTSQDFSAEEENKSSNSAIYPRKTDLTFKKMRFCVQSRSSRPKIDSICQFQQLSSRGKFLHFQNFWDVSMRKKQQQQPP